MKALYLYCIFMLACIDGRCAGNIDSILKSLNKGEVTFGDFPTSFSDFSQMNIQDTNCYFIGDNMEGVQVAYCQAKTDKYTIDMLHVNGRNYKLFFNPDDDKKYDMQIEKAMLYRIRTKDRRYICITGVIDAKNHISSFVLIDITDNNKIKIGQLLSYVPSIHAFADLNNDGELDFVQIKPMTRAAITFVAEACNLDGDRIKPKKGKVYSFLLSGTDDAAISSEWNWF